MEQKIKELLDYILNEKIDYEELKPRPKYVLEEFFKIAENRLKGISQQDIREKEQGIQNIFDFMEEVK